MNTGLRLESRRSSTKSCRATRIILWDVYEMLARGTRSAAGDRFCVCPISHPCSADRVNGASNPVPGKPVRHLNEMCLKWCWPPVTAPCQDDAPAKHVAWRVNFGKCAGFAFKQERGCSTGRVAW